MIKEHEHILIEIGNIYIPFEDNPYWKYSQHHCDDLECDYHEFRYVSHNEVSK